MILQCKTMRLYMYHSFFHEYIILFPNEIKQFYWKSVQISYESRVHTTKIRTKTKTKMMDDRRGIKKYLKLRYITYINIHKHKHIYTHDIKIQFFIEINSTNFNKQVLLTFQLCFLTIFFRGCTIIVIVAALFIIT